LLLAALLAGSVGAVSWQVASSPKATARDLPVVVRSAPVSGIYVGPGDPGSVIDFGHWRKVPVGFASDFISSVSWTEIAKPTWLLGRWQGSGFKLMLGVPMLPDAGPGSIAAGARGDFNHYFRTLAQNLVRYGAASASLRIGWEMNGAWYRWSAVEDPAGWIAFYRQIVTTMRSVPGARFTFVWNPNIGTRSMDAAAAYPGDAYVDEIGMDVYDWEWNTPEATPQSRWDWILTHPNGLTWLAEFSQAHFKPISLPEWGLARPEENTNGGGGDDPYYIRQLLEWCATHNVASESYFDYGTHRLASFPNAARAYRGVVQELDRLTPVG
jgi:hypothetical protein